MGRATAPATEIVLLSVLVLAIAVGSLPFTLVASRVICLLRQAHFRGWLRLAELFLFLRRLFLWLATHELEVLAPVFRVALELPCFDHVEGLLDVDCFRDEVTQTNLGTKFPSA